MQRARQKRMTNETAEDIQLQRLLITAKAEVQALKDEDKDVVIRGKALAETYQLMIQIIEDLQKERNKNNGSIPLR